MSRTTWHSIGESRTAWLGERWSWWSWRCKFHLPGPMTVCCETSGLRTLKDLTVSFLCWCSAHWLESKPSLCFNVSTCIVHFITLSMSRWTGISPLKTRSPSSLSWMTGNDLSYRYSYELKLDFSLTKTETLARVSNYSWIIRWCRSCLPLS